MKLKLQQGQVWQKGEEFFRIVHLERLSVGFKTMTDPLAKVGTHQTVTKKEFCRLIKGAQLAPLP